ncbi:uncharacterized protein LOC126803717 [Argentina anserina]|uniref:uncharacterized protein LOC126803717 n=1 Tax=Argentina anserina TaxID=57926 RepID=UPI0021768D89|nr:uncharacterized protein LOC126803717 [Potentilla anserina]
MPQTKHRLCEWHIGRNVGQNVKDEKLQKALGMLIYTSYSKYEWEREWGKMVREHNVEENTWIQSLHNKRKKWVEAYCSLQLVYIDVNVSMSLLDIDKWICSTQRCEGMNRTMKLKVGKSTTLIEFVPRCWVVQFIARNSEKSQDESYSCSCELFESDDIPCAHIFCAMKNEGVFVYPKSLICERWKKSSGSRPLDKTSVEVQVIGFAPCRYLSLIAAAKRACYNFSQSAEGFEKGLVALAKLEEDSFEFRAKKKPRLIVEDNNNVVLEPIVARTKGKYCNAENGLLPNGTKVKACGHCRVPGHNLRTCPELQRDDNGK